MACGITGDGSTARRLTSKYETLIYVAIDKLPIDADTDWNDRGIKGTDVLTRCFFFGYLIVYDKIESSDRLGGAGGELAVKKQNPDQKKQRANPMKQA